MVKQRRSYDIKAGAAESRRDFIHKMKICLKGGSAPMHPEGMQEQGCGSYQETVAPEALKACSRWLSEATPPERSIHDPP